MNDWWTPIWSEGNGPDRLYCGIAQTEEGFAVDVFRGDTCIEGLVYTTRTEAVRGAAAFERQFIHETRPHPLRVAATERLAAHS